LWTTKKKSTFGRGKYGKKALLGGYRRRAARLKQRGMNRERKEGPSQEGRAKRVTDLIKKSVKSPIASPHERSR